MMMVQRQVCILELVLVLPVKKDGGVALVLKSVNQRQMVCFCNTVFLLMQMISRFVLLECIVILHL